MPAGGQASVRRPPSLTFALVGADRNDLLCYRGMYFLMLTYRLGFVDVGTTGSSRRNSLTRVNNSPTGLSCGVP
jgi:hypothetical protein